MSMIRQLFLLFCITILLSATNALAAEATAGMDFGTSYVFRGAALNDSYVAQPYLEVSGFPKVEGLTVGTWGNLDLDDNRGGEPESGQFSEVDFYGSYDLPLDCEIFGAALGYTEYMYPGADADDDREISLTLSADTVLSPSLGVFYGLDGGIEEAVYLEFGVGHEVPLSDEVALSLGGTAAYLFQAKDSAADDGFSYASVSAGISYEFISATVSYYFETDDDVLSVDEDLQGILGFSYSF